MVDPRPILPSFNSSGLSFELKYLKAIVLISSTPVSALSESERDVQNELPFRLCNSSRILWHGKSRNGLDRADLGAG